MNVDFESRKATIVAVSGHKMDMPALNAAFTAKGLPYRATVVHEKAATPSVSSTD